MDRQTLLHDVLDTQATHRPQAPALLTGGAVLSYRALAALSAQYATVLSGYGVGSGDRVLIGAPHDPRTPALVFATSRLGAIHVVVSDRLPANVLSHVLADCEPRVVVGAPELVATAGHLGAAALPIDALPAEPAGRSPDLPAAPAAPDDPVSLTYTSGSTALPKAVVSTHRQVRFATNAIGSVLDYRPDDTVFCCLPLSFDYGLYQIFLSCRAGARLALADDGAAGPALLSLLRDTGATVLPLVPTLAQVLLRLTARPGPRLDRLRLVTNTGAHLPDAVAHRLRDQIPGMSVVAMFGLTECKRVSIMEPDGDLTRPGSVGRPLPGTEIYVVDTDGRRLPDGETGELVVRGPHVMAGYWRAPELTARRFGHDEHGPVLYTGDRCRIEDGYLYFVGRDDDIYKHRGYRVSTIEVEAAAAEIDDVELAAVLPPSGDDSALLVVTGSISPSVVLKELTTRLEPAKVPDRCLVVDRLPLGTTGKVDKRALAAELRMGSA